ncbi:MAG TPA: glycosyltransferase family 61 protein [Stellaceae bacterium]|nr:glycosyltransferase family 61 protein [Stellaceae bacterium]
MPFSAEALQVHTLASLPARVRTFRNIVVYPTQELLRHLSGGAFFRGGPDWPRFPTQIYARHCWNLIPRPVDSRPYRAEPASDRIERGIWCGPVSNHFGHMVADFGMRIALSSRLDPVTPLVFSIAPDAPEPPAFFRQILDHLGVDQRRILLVRHPTRFGELLVAPQAERRFGGRPARRHLRMMDALTSNRPPPVCPSAERVFVSRGRWPKGRFAAESYLDEVFAAAGVTVFHPETVDLHTQLRVYRGAHTLIFSEGSALHALQLLGHVDADVAVLARRPGKQIAASSLRPRVRSLRYIPAARGVIYGVSRSGRAQLPAGISVLDESACINGLRALGVDLGGIWEPHRHAESRDAEIAAWIAYRLATATHPGERQMIEQRLRAVSLPHLIP